MAATSASGNALFDTVKGLFIDICACATSLGATNFSDSSLADHLMPMLSIRQQLMKQLWTLTQDTSAQRAVTRGSTFLEVYSKLISTLVKQLGRLDMSSPKQPQLHTSMFIELWGCLHASSLTFTYFWALCHSMDQSALNAANHALMLWVLPFVTSSYHQRPGPDYEKRASELTAIMQIPLNSLNHISCTGGYTMPRALSMLHADYVPLLCRIACEKVGSLTHEDSDKLRAEALKATAAAILSPNPRNVGCHPHPVPHDFEHLVAVAVAVINCSDALISSNPQLLASFTNPAVHEALKYAIILCGPQRGVANLAQGDSCLRTLMNLINMGMHIMISRVASGLPSVAPVRARHAGPNLTPPERRTDLLLLETLGKRMANDPATAFLTFDLMGVVMQIWRQAEEGAVVSVSEQVLMERDYCIVMLVQQSTLYVRKLMREQQVQRGREGRRSAKAGQAGVPGLLQPRSMMEVDAQGCFGPATLTNVQSLLGLLCMNIMRVQGTYVPRTAGELCVVGRERTD